MKPRRYRFDDYLLDASARELWHGGERVAIPPKSLECLAYLLEHRERAVGRDELITAIWGRVDASDTLLTQTIWRARRAIGEDGDRSLRTVPRFGYRWVAAVCEDDGEPAPATTPAEEGLVPARDEPIRRRRVSGARLALGAALAAGVAAAALLALHFRSGAGVVPSRVVVLPVAVADPTSETAWLRLGAMDYVASRLRDARLNVLPSERVVAIAKATSTAPDAAERERLARLTSADYLVVPRAALAEGVWRFSIEAYRAGRARTFRAEASTPLQAANLAAAQFLEDTGHAAAPGAAPPGPTRELVQRVDAALLEGDLAKARQSLAAASPEQRADPELRVREGRVAFRSGKLDEAEAAFAPLLADGADTPAATRVLAEMGLGAVGIRRHAFEDARSHYTAALDALGSSGDMSLLGRAYTERAVVEGSLGRVDLAVADIARARGELERSGDPLGLASLDLNGALIEHQRGRYADAARLFDRAIDAYARFDIADQLAIALAGKVDTELAVLDRAGAVASSERAWNMLPRLEDHLLIEFLAARRVQALRLDGRLAEAARVLDRFAPTGDHASADPAFGMLRAAVLVDQGKAPLALRMADGLMSQFESAPAGSCSDNVPQAALILTDAALQSREPAAAAPLLARLGELAASPQDPEWMFASDLARAELFAAEGDPEAARRFASALAFADGTAEPARIVLAASRYADYAVQRSDRTLAESLLARLAPYAKLDYRAARATAQLHAMLGATREAEAALLDARRLAGERPVDRVQLESVAMRVGGGAD